MLVVGSVARADIAPLAEGYRELSTLLAADKYEETSLYAAQLSRRAEVWIESESPAAPALEWATSIVTGAEKMGKTKDAEALREAYGEVSQGAIRLIKNSPLQASWQLFYCPMVKNYWAQPKTEKMANPYMGLEMLTCGGKKAWTVLP